MNNAQPEATPAGRRDVYPWHRDVYPWQTQGYAGGNYALYGGVIEQKQAHKEGQQIKKIVIAGQQDHGLEKQETAGGGMAEVPGCENKKWQD